MAKSRRPGYTCHCFESSFTLVFRSQVSNGRNGRFDFNEYQLSSPCGAHVRPNSGNLDLLHSNCCLSALNESDRWVWEELMVHAAIAREGSDLIEQKGVQK